jgi:hypothetical protein
MGLHAAEEEKVHIDVSHLKDASHLVKVPYKYRRLKSPHV